MFILVPLLTAITTNSMPSSQPLAQRELARNSNSFSILPVKTETLEIYVTSWCPHCRHLESFLKDQKIAHKSYDIEKSAEGAKRYQALGAGGIPLIKYGPYIIRGFDKNALLELLGSKHRPKTIQS